jgi:hypothetical protein
MIRRFPILICWVSAILALTGSSPAQSGSYSAGFYTRGADTAMYLDQGSSVIDPFYIPAQNLSLLPRLSISVLHEDNVFLTPDDQTQGTSVSVVPGLMAIWGRRTASHVYADYGLIVPVYESVKVLNDQPSHLLSLGGTYRTGKSQVHAQVGYRQLEDVDTVVGDRISKQDLIANLSAEYRVSGKSSLGLLGRAEMHEFDLDRYMDYNRYYGAGRLYRRMTAKSDLFLQAGLGRDDPKQQEFEANAAQFYDLSLGIRGKQSPKFNTSGRVGYMFRQYDDETREDLGHWITSLKAESTPFGLSTFTGEIFADVRPAIDSAGTDIIDQGGIATVSRRLFIDRLRGNASIMGGVVDYSGGTTLAVDGTEGEATSLDGRSDNYWGFSVGMDWYTRAHFSVGVNYSYMQRNGDQDGSEAAQESSSYEYARWSLRASWNY